MHAASVTSLCIRETNQLISPQASGSRAKRQQGDNWRAKQAAMNIGDKEAVRHKPMDDEGSGSEEDF